MIKNILTILFVSAVLICFINTIVWSEPDEEIETMYIDECGSCHFAYQPELLPEASWLKIISGLNNHFGESVILLDNAQYLIEDYLRSRSAEHSSNKHSMKIMGSLGAKAPLRITDVPYIRKKHKDISPAIFERESVISFSNCVACHIGAEDGIYSDDEVSIPE